jgi:hypothetical protein
MSNLILVTVLYNYPEYIQPIFHKSAKKSFNDNEIIVFRDNSDMDEQYKLYSNSQNDYYSKLYYYKIIKLRDNIIKYIKNNDYLLFMDALDTGIVTDKNDILDKFKTFSCDIVMGAERGIWPPTKYVHLYNTNELDTPYLNSGTYIGSRDAIIDALDKMISHGRDDVSDDQGAWTRLFLINDANIKLDYDRKIFFSTHESKELLVINDNKFNGFVKHTPSIIHDNGPFNEEKTFKLADFYSKDL